MKNTAAHLFAQCLVAQGVELVFGIPGAKIDALFDALKETPIQIIVCRHEQNAAFMAAAYGRLTGKPGVVVVTSGPGVSNLVTGLLTATTEGDPVVAIGGNVSRSMKYKESHQAADNVSLMRAASKYCVEVSVVANIPEVIENAFRISALPRCGAAFISVPQDILSEQTALQSHEALNPIEFGQASPETIDAVAASIEKARCPVLFLGEEASRVEVTAALHQLLHHHKMVTVSTYQAAGALSRALKMCFAGRVGLFKNQPGDKWLEDADLIITVGYNPAEYDPEIWNSGKDKRLIHLDYHCCDIHTAYRPDIECLGAIEKNLLAIKQLLPVKSELNVQAQVNQSQQAIQSYVDKGAELNGFPIHPLRFIHDMRQVIDADTLVIADVGSHAIWLSRYHWTYKPRHFLVSNGQQTLGVALPWAMGAHFANSEKRMISISGDGGFLFSAMELETAVRLGISLVHVVWVDGYYNMVKEQQLMKYGRDCAVKLGRVDYVAFAHSFGAHGLRIESAEQIQPCLRQAWSLGGPVLIEVAIDYSDNPMLFQQLHDQTIF